VTNTVGSILGLNSTAGYMLDAEGLGKVKRNGLNQVKLNILMCLFYI
jgi:hypothetical protein